MTDQEFLEAISALGKIVTMAPSPIAPSRKRIGTFATEADEWLAWWESWAGDVDAMQASLARLMPIILNAQESAGIALLASNFKGEWSALSGGLSKPASVKHSDAYWLLNSDLTDATLSEPSDANADWSKYVLDVAAISGLIDAINVKQPKLLFEKSLFGGL